MKLEDVKLIIASLLHDIGKVVYRAEGCRETHSVLGVNYLKEVGIKDNDILNCVKYHHGDKLKNANISESDLAYIVYIADNIAAAADRREDDDLEYGFDKFAQLQSVFNILNKNKGCGKESYKYKPVILKSEEDINYPENKEEKFTDSIYNNICINIKDSLKGIDFKDENVNDYINSLLLALEANLTYVPSSTKTDELMDISLYDHLKLTAAFAICIKKYLEEKNILDYKTELFKNASGFYEKDVFLLASLDVSGIQNFIYTISTKDALKTLRARSFYLEIMMEHIIDLILERMNLCRANLIYVGGGHCYMLLPNTEKIKMQFENIQNEINEWFLENFKTALYIAGGYAECSCKTLQNNPNGSYREVFRKVSRNISDKKSNRYTAEQIMKLNKEEKDNYIRECKVCKNSSKVDEDDVCPMCNSIKIFSKEVLYSEIFVVYKEASDGLPLPGNYKLKAYNKKGFTKGEIKEELDKLLQDENTVRLYTKNKYYTGKKLSTKIWVGDYTTGDTFERFAKELSHGIGRVGILRADVDNLGKSFVEGFEDKYATLTRSATLSRQLSLFFKLYINSILKKSECHMYDVIETSQDSDEERKATIVYSGGDDVFIVGAWDDVIGLAIDLREAFSTYSQEKLTLSAGIGVYKPGYPISVIATEVEKLVDESKKMDGKDSITLFEDGQKHEELAQGETIEIGDGTYKWNDFIDGVRFEKLDIISDFMNKCEDKGKSFLYKLLELIRNQDEKINFARLIYLLSRIEPEKNIIKDDEKYSKQKEAYDKFCEKIVTWIKNKDDIRQLKTAITLYAYLIREKE